MAAAAPAATRSTVELALRGQRRDVGGRLFAGALLVTLLLSLFVLLILLASVVGEAWPVLSDRGLGFLNDNLSSFEERAGVRQGLIGSLVLIAFVGAIAVPLGIGAAIYLEEYALDTRANRLLIANIRNLAGVPSIVYGILGVVVFAQTFRSITGPEVSGLSYLSGGLTLAVLVMPFIIIITMEALRAVPSGIREAAYGVGATRWEVVRSHVLPYAAPGVFTGGILALARAFGETAPLLLVGAVTGYLSPGGSKGIVETIQGAYTALPTIIFTWSRQPGQEWKHLTAAAIVVLLAVILVVNLTAILLRNRYERKW
ncbi:MAG TPA: phosphate ABC transporter permease PstA [Actinomycetota bacterium]|nr:phosphate ABC transporter permease PstA [Actinomycetota bacterium]